ncbi:hypothetical protein FH972_010624 [Carpinus fangiana]|uniref:Uncharacterized protein n=1 Tax=Carpinus fangiana TaxID=176857 RepID=A0A660KQW8_9ROSI|nr:hypothetical protein FH972_010624 [Carpinus fangiana]
MIPGGKLWKALFSGGCRAVPVRMEQDGAGVGREEQNGAGVDTAVDEPSNGGPLVAILGVGLDADLVLLRREWPVLYLCRDLVTPPEPARLGATAGSQHGKRWTTWKLEMRASGGGDDGRRIGWPWRAGAARRFTVLEPVLGCLQRAARLQ